MKILIVDDQPPRYTRLIEALAQLGVSRDQIDIELSANSARDRLDSKRYDLLILDILLPLWPESEPSVQHSLDLLLELQESAELLKPGHILGITVDLELARETAVKLEEWTWTVVQYKENSDEWINRVANCVRYILKEGEQLVAIGELYETDLAIICALPKPELEELLRLPWNWSSPRPISDMIFVYDGHFVSGGRTISVCATAVTRVGMVSAAIVSAALIVLLRPKLIAMCGICAGVRGRAQIGDVLFADPAWDFQSGKRVRENDVARFAIAPHQLHPPELIRSHVDQIRLDEGSLQDIAASFGAAVPSPLRVLIGPVATGSPVVADGQVVEEIQAQHRELIGIEMEIYGLYAAAHCASKPRPMPFALKAVCDFADSSKNDDHQRYAAFASANVLRMLMERFAIRLLD